MSRDHLAHLEVLAQDLEDALDGAIGALSSTMPDVPPMLVRDTSGRFVLADMLVSLVNAKTALLLRMPTPRPERVPPAGESGVSRSPDGRR